MAEEKLRAFLAVALSESMLQEAQQFVAHIQSFNPKFRYIPKDNWHLTLHFLGSIDAAQLPKLKDALQAAFEKASPFELQLRGSGGFPPGKRHHLLWLGVDGELETLNHIYHLEEDVLSAHSIKVEDRPFHPHITIARCKEKLPCQFGESEIEFASRTKMRADHVTLFQSRLSSEGSVYTKLFSVPLGNPGA